MKMKRALLVLLAVCMAAALCACGSVESKYSSAQEKLSKGKYSEAAEAFDALGDYEDAAKLAMYAKAGALGESGQYDAAIDAFKSFGDFKSSPDMAKYYRARKAQAQGDYEDAVKRYGEIPLFKDSAERAEACKQAMYDIAEEYAKQGKLYHAYRAFDRINSKYQYSDSKTRADKYLKQLEDGYAAALALEKEGKYEKAVAAYEKLDGFDDSGKRISACREQIRLAADYQAVKALEDAGDYEKAVTAYKALGDYSDSKARLRACENAKKEKDYQAALKLQEDGKYDEAYDIYRTLVGYRDVDSIIRTDKNIKYVPYKTAGSYVTFGSYPQTAAGTDSTPIEWLVLEYDAANNKALLISQYALDCQQYNTKYTDVTWETCTLRGWLNREFMNKAFSAEEQKAILTTDVDNSKSQGYSGYGTDGGKNTKDKIFLLSYAEANQYFGVQYYSVDGAEDNLRSRVTPTDHAVRQGAYKSSSYTTSEGKAAAWWWLRSPGSSASSAALVRSNGVLYLDSVNGSDRAVRPAFWLDLNSDIF